MTRLILFLLLIFNVSAGSILGKIDLKAESGENLVPSKAFLTFRLASSHGNRGKPFTVTWVHEEVMLPPVLVVKPGTQVNFERRGRSSQGLRIHGPSTLIRFGRHQRSLEKVFEREGRYVLDSLEQPGTVGTLFVADYDFSLQPLPSGFFSKEDIPPGHYEIQVYYPGWRQERKYSFEVSEDKTTAVKLVVDLKSDDS